MIKKSLVEGLFLTILFYIVLILLNILEINPFSNFAFSTQGFFLIYIFIALGTLAYARL